MGHAGLGRLGARFCRRRRVQSGKRTTRFRRQSILALNAPEEVNPLGEFSCLHLVTTGADADENTREPSRRNEDPTTLLAT
ncbi:unnamed protein product, partial [Discosporangium mesarthrocarpum]